METPITFKYKISSDRPASIKDFEFLKGQLLKKLREIVSNESIVVTDLNTTKNPFYGEKDFLIEICASSILLSPTTLTPKD